MLPMSMEMPGLDFQLSTENQNGRHLASNLKKKKIHNSLETLYIYIGFRGLRVY